MDFLSDGLPFGEDLCPVLLMNELYHTLFNMSRGKLKIIRLFSREEVNLMKTRFLVLFVLFALTCATGIYAGGADTTPPTIMIGIADPNRMDRVLPIAQDNTVQANARGYVKFRALATDGGSGVRSMFITVPNASAAMFVSPSAWAIIGASAKGEEITVTVAARDAAGNRSERTITVTVRK